MSQLTSHVLDTATGKPAEGIPVTVYQTANGLVTEIASGITNKDGRITDLLPAERKLQPATYKLVFFIREYFAKQSLSSFYPDIEINFIISDDSHYHIPLLLSPFGYTTYRGS